MGGDLIKAYYLKKENSSQASTSPYTVIFDRIIGLYVMMGLASLIIAFNIQFISRSSQLSTVSSFVFAIFIGLNILAVAVFVRPLRHFVQGLIPKRWPKLNRLLLDIMGGFEFYARCPWRVLYCLFLSLLAQILSITCLYVIGIAAGNQDIPLSAYFFVAPIGFALAGLPIAPPGGVGAGQAAFLVLFNIYLGQKTSIGPTVITVFQFISLCIGFAGLFFYLTRKKAS